jgi:subtilisin family serine protease
VAVLDNGLKFDHPLMQASKVIPGYDFLDNDADASEEEGYLLGHGTFVTGVVLMISPNCSILPIRVMSGDGYGCEFYIAKGLVWAVTHGADIANLSFGSETRSNLMSEAVAFAGRNGVVMVASAGNEASARPMYPAALELTMAVGAIDTTELLADFSSFGKFIDLVAPGVNIYSAMAGEYEWGTWSGTSFSAPMVSGTAALILELAPGLTPVQVRSQLTRTARTTLLWGTIIPPDQKYGAGVLNACEAVRTITLGDIDRSGFTDHTDLSLLAAFIRTGHLPADGVADFAMADLDCNGKVNMSDLTLLTAIVTGSPALHRATRCVR